MGIIVRKGTGPQVRRVTDGLTREIGLLAGNEREARIITGFTDQLELIARYELPPLEEGYGSLSLKFEMVRD